MTRGRRAAEIRDSIRHVLFENWDPIGVNENPKLSDEYDSYVAPIYRLLTGSRSEDELVAYLRTLEQQFGMHRHVGSGLAMIAQELLALDVHLEHMHPNCSPSGREEA